MTIKYLLLFFVPLLLQGTTWSLTVMESTPPTINGVISEKTQSLLTKLSNINEDYKNKTKLEIDKKAAQTNSIRNLEREILVELKNITFNKEVLVKINAVPTGVQK